MSDQYVSDVLGPFIHLTFGCKCSDKLCEIVQVQIGLDPIGWLTIAANIGDLRIVKYAAVLAFRKARNRYCCMNCGVRGAKFREWCQVCDAYESCLEIAKYMTPQEAINWDDCMEGGARGGHLEIVRYAAEQGATNWKTSEAACEGHQEIVDFLRQRKNLK